MPANVPPRRAQGNEKAERRANRDRLLAIARQQGGVVHIKQAQAIGITRRVVDRAVAGGRWQRPHRKLLIPSPEPLRDRGRAWGAHLLADGSGAVGGEAGLWLARLRPTCPPQVLLFIDERVRITRPPSWVAVRRRRGLVALRQPLTTPARLRIEVLVLDAITPDTRVNDVAALLTRACQQRLTTPERLLAALASRRFQPGRKLILELLSDVVEGAQSGMEIRYLREVERAHGLPRGERNLAEATHGGTRYRDLRYRLYRLVVELDGALYHPETLRHLDQWRDNELLVDGVVTLRYRWAHLADPCAVALQVAQVLRAAGWRGKPKACGPNCPVTG